jgi:hypothetical protein
MCSLLELRFVKIIAPNGDLCTYEPQYEFIVYNNVHYRHRTLYLKEYQLIDCSFNPHTARIGDIFWGILKYDDRYCLDVVYKEKIDALHKYYHLKNVLLKKIIDDSQIPLNTKKRRKRRKNYISSIERDIMKAWNLHQFKTFELLLDYTLSHYSESEKFEKIYDDYQQLYLEKYKHLLICREYSRVICHSDTINTEPSASSGILFDTSSGSVCTMCKEQKEFVDFFKYLPGLRHQIGGLILRYYS